MLLKPVCWTLAACVFLGAAFVAHRRLADPDTIRDLPSSLRVAPGGAHARRPISINYRPASPLPPTNTAGHRELTSADQAALDVHRENEELFLSETGFGYTRAYQALDDSGRFWSSRSIRRAELVSLLKGSEPAAYVLEQMPFAPTSDQATRRPLDPFETEALAALRGGAKAVASTADPKRFMGAIRARQECLDCHTGHQPGDVLGAFTYYLEKPLGSAPTKLAAR